MLFIRQDSYKPFINLNNCIKIWLSNAVPYSIQFEFEKNVTIWNYDEEIHREFVFDKIQRLVEANKKGFFTLN